MSLPFAIVTPWHNPAQRDAFLDAWGIKGPILPDYLILQQDTRKEGCARTKNKGIAKAIEMGAEVVCVLDDDCGSYLGGFKDHDDAQRVLTLEEFADLHIKALNPAPVAMIERVTDPGNRGTPYFNRHITMPVAASVGQWTNIGDYDAPSQLVHGAAKPMTFRRHAIHGKYFAMSGMNVAFRAESWPWCQFVNVPRMDDIWAFFIWQKIAYSRGQCFNLAGPLVRHSRQSNVWQNLRDEAVNLERNETIWQEIHALPEGMSHAEILEALGLTV